MTQSALFADKLLKRITQRVEASVSAHRMDQEKGGRAVLTFPKMYARFGLLPSDP